MPRRRWVIPIVLLAIAAGGVEGYRLAHPDPSPVLRTIIIAANVGNFGFDPAHGHLYVGIKPGGVLMIDTQSGAVQDPLFLNQLISPPEVDDRFNHLFDHNTGFNQVMLDARTGVLLRTIKLPETDVQGFYVDSPGGRIYYNYQSTGIVTMVDMRTGSVLHNIKACMSPAATVASGSGGRLFVPCPDGRTMMYDARSGRLLRTLNTSALGVADCWPMADEKSGTVLLPNTKGLGILDGRTGALIRTVPVRICPNGGLEVDPATGQILVAPYVLPPAKPIDTVLVLDGRSGAVLHRWAVPEWPSDLLYNPLSGHLLVVSAGPLDKDGNPIGDGTLSVLDATRGAILRTIEMGIWPGTLFVDTAAKRLLVLNWAERLDGNAVTRDYPEGAWPRFARRLKGAVGWLPFDAPAPPPPSTDSTFTMLDLSKL